MGGLLAGLSGSRGLDPAFHGPWRLPQNRVRRFYRGGAELERFRSGGSIEAEGGVTEARDGNRPEDWVGSVTRAWTPPGTDPTDDGLGVAEVEGQRRRLDDLLGVAPELIAGSEFVAAAGPTTGLLVKLLDAAVRLPVHAHPTRAFARAHLSSFFGKTEAWIVLSTRQTGDPEGPHVRIGFHRDLRRDELLDLIEGQRADALLASMHQRPTRAGDVWFIPAGVPHAIGAGVFMVEVEEPTDYSIVAETSGLPIVPEDAHLGLGWDVMIDAFDRAGHDAAWLDGLRHDRRRAPTRGESWQVTPLLDVDADPYFAAVRVTIRGSARPVLGPEAFLVGVVTGGSGTVRAGGRELAVRAGETFAVPAVVMPDLEFDAPDGVELIICLPPRPADLALAPA